MIKERVNRLTTISQLHDAYDRGEFTPTDVTEFYLKANEQDTLNAVLLTIRDRSLKQANEATAILKKRGKVDRENQPLFGTCIGIKDLLTISGIRTTCASKILENYVPPYTATAVKRLEEAGAISVSKLNMDEFAMGGANENSAFGSVKHPMFNDRVPGGSSGGSAAAVAAGLCHAALGSDTGGSIRLPASFCGIVGSKPTYGRISRFGLVAFSSSLDQIGPMTRSVEDARILTDIMSGYDPNDMTSVKTVGNLNGRKSPQGTAFDWKNCRIGVPKEYFQGGLSKEVENNIRTSIDWFKKKGSTVIDVSLPHSPYCVAIYYIIAVSEASSNLERFDGIRFGQRVEAAKNAEDLADFYFENRALFGSEVKRRIILGTFALSSGYYDAYFKKACQVRALLKKDFDHAFNQVDFIVGPVAPTTAFKIGEKPSDPLQRYLMDLYTIPANLAGLPAISVPCGLGNGLPIGIHMIANRFKDDELFEIAKAFEQDSDSSKKYGYEFVQNSLLNERTS